MERVFSGLLRAEVELFQGADCGEKLVGLMLWAGGNDDEKGHN